MTNGKTWVTIKVPEERREEAADLKPDSVTWGDCLVAGADRLNETEGQDMSHLVNADPKAIREFVEQFDPETSDVELEWGTSDVDVDVDRIINRIDDLETELKSTIELEVGR